MPWLQWQIPEGISMKLWHHLWPFKGHKLTLNWKRYRSPTGSWILKRVLDSERIRAIISYTYRWDIIIFEHFHKKIPRSNDIREETIHVSIWFTFYHMKSIALINIKQLSAIKRKFVFCVREGTITDNFMRLHLRRLDKVSQPNYS